MKRLLTVLSLFFVFSISNASHVSGGYIEIKHISGFNFLMKVTLYRDVNGIGNPNWAYVNVYEKETRTEITTFTASLDSIDSTNYNLACGMSNNIIETYYLSDTIILDSVNFSHPGGYLFRYTVCCRNAGVINLMNSSSQGIGIMTFYSTIDPNTNQFLFNSTPEYKTPVSNTLCHGVPYSKSFGATDVDGDQRTYALFSPKNHWSVNSGVVTSVFAPYKDPETMTSSIQWANCYHTFNQIYGISSTTCGSSGIDGFTINSNSGMVNCIPGSPGPGFYQVGIRCIEKRNGTVISAVYRDLPLFIEQCFTSNNPPQVHVPQLQSLASWGADTMIFTGSPVCVQIGITDPDTFADINVEAVYSDYDPGDLIFVQSTGTILNNDTFQTALCFQPDSFLPYTTRGDVVALNPGCYDLRGDTLPFYFKFVGYSNAGWGGIQTVAMSNVSGDIDLFQMLNHNPNAGGQWIEIINSGRLQSNGMFSTSNLPIPSSYEFYYIDLQPNYPADTAYLKVNFVQTSSLGMGEVQEINIYPNPANDVLTISGISDKAVFEVFDIHGKKIKSETLNDSDNSINTTELREGLYFYQLNNQRGKFLIQR